MRGVWAANCLPGEGGAVIGGHVLHADDGQHVRHGPDQLVLRTWNCGSLFGVIARRREKRGGMVREVVSRDAARQSSCCLGEQGDG